MRFKIHLLIAFILILMLEACGQSKIQYGKDPLPVDDFQFDAIDLDVYFQDESIFKIAGDSEYNLSSEETVLKNDSIMPGYITYYTRMRSQAKPLAKYAGVEFDNLGLVTDWEDEHLLMVCGTSTHKTAEEVMTIIQQLKKEYGAEPELQKNSFMGQSQLILVYPKPDKEVQFCIKLPDVDFIDWSKQDISECGNEYDVYEYPKKGCILLTPEIENKIQQKLKKENNDCSLFITQVDLAKVLKQKNGSSGFLVDYWKGY
ncbi:hypothetical protein MG290_13435 [Flavobacterium sp. CBA20B-1]|uniref:hypothetical protein n=1 Tax=unclassified Flavobacterium TaxID=196869 RepID=UPI0022253C5F|nr:MULTISPECIES: hypothetical protein [unclassified Flavobacterium]WCM41927.1 hypothetical protein MG290_13435 [Flavobacterium sp. CBA20B-1]